MTDHSPNGSPAGRDRVTGYFQTGNTFSRGNTGARRMQELRQAILDAVTADQVKAVFNKLAELAGGGDVGAARVFLEHVIGKPTQALELSGPAGESLGPNFSSLTRMLLTALADHPRAKIALAAELHKMSQPDDETEPDQVPGDRA